jgi:two-component system, sensor histidine kinase
MNVKIYKHTACFTFICMLSFGFLMAQELPDSILNKLENASVDTIKVNILNKYAFSVFRSNPDATLKFARQALDISKEQEYLSGQVKALNYIGIAYHILGEFDSARSYYNQSLNIVESTNDKKYEASIHNNLGLLFVHHEYYKLALEHQLKSLGISESLKDTNGLINSYNNIGIIYESMEEYRSSIDFHQNTLKFANQKDNPSAYYNALGNIGINYNYLGIYDSATQFLNQATKFFIKSEDAYGIAQSYSYLSDLYFNESKEDSFLFALNQSNKYANSIGDKNLIARNLIRAGKFYQKNHDFPQAREYFETSKDIAQEKDFPKIEMEAYKQLSEIDSSQKNFQKAYYNFKSSVKLKNFLDSKEIQRQLAEMQIIYETKQKDIAILSLQQERELQKLKIRKNKTDINLLLIIVFLSLSGTVVIIFYYIKNRQLNQLLKEQNDELAKHKENLKDEVEIRTSELKNALIKAEESDKLKTAFLSNISHELRTPLNGIVGFSDLIKETKKSLSIEKLEKYTSILSQSSLQLVKIIEDIVFISRIESKSLSINSDIINITEFLQEIKKSYIPSRKDVNFLLHLQENQNITTIFTDKELLKTILIQLLDNAFKFTHKGVVEMGWSFEKEIVIIYIKDSGIGIHSSKFKDIFKPFIKAHEEKEILYGGNGLGLAIVSGLLRILGLESAIFSSPGNGTEFKILFNVEKK